MRSTVEDLERQSGGHVRLERALDIEALDCGSEVRVIVSPCGIASSSPTAGDTLEVLVTLPASTLPVRVELAPPTADASPHALRPERAASAASS